MMTAHSTISLSVAHVPKSTDHAEWWAVFEGNRRLPCIVFKNRFQPATEKFLRFETL